MQDGIIKGNGNSRYLKTVAEALTIYPTYEDFMAALIAGTLPIDLNGINAAGWAQLGSALNKENLLKDATAALYGLGADAVPDEVLAMLGQYNQYWWRRRTEKVVTAVQSGNRQTVIIYKASGTTVYRSVEYSDSLTVNKIAESLSLTTPTQSVQAIYTGYTAYEILRGNFIYIGGVCYYVPEDAVLTQKVDEDAYYCVYITAIPYGVEVTPDGEWEYIRSSDRNAYPDSGIVDGYEYEYLGEPLNNAVEALKIGFGSYMGTGTYGADNPNSITFDFTPKFIIMTGWVTSSGAQYSLHHGGDTASTYSFVSFYLVPESFTSGFGFGYYQGGFYGKRDGNTLSWYNTTSDSNQYNTTRAIYHYAYIG